MATTDIFHISGGLVPARKAIKFLTGNTDDFIEVNAFAATRVSANDAVGTFTAWIMIADDTITGTIIGNGDDSIVEFLEILVESGLLTVRITDATVVQVVTQANGDALKRHRWYHIAVVQKADGVGPKLYIDGSLIASTNDTTTDVDSWFAELDGIDKGLIGASNKTGNSAITNEFTGSISDVKYWNVALTDAQVLSDFEEQIPDDITGTPGDLKNHWDFDDDLIDNVAAENGTNTGGGAILVNNWAEFSSRLAYDTGTPIVADTLQCWSSGNNNQMGHAIVIQAA